MMSSNMYFSDSEYLDILKRGRENLDKIDKIYSYDSKQIGNKYTESNVGLCNENLTTMETALLPKDFPRRKSMKYFLKIHKCPLDSRPSGSDFSSGCFYSCRVFKSRKFKSFPNLDEIKNLYDAEISYFEEFLKNKSN